MTVNAKVEWRNSRGRGFSQCLYWPSYVRTYSNFELHLSFVDTHPTIHQHVGHSSIGDAIIGSQINETNSAIDAESDCSTSNRHPHHPRWRWSNWSVSGKKKKKEFDKANNLVLKLTLYSSILIVALLLNCLGLVVPRGLVVGNGLKEASNQRWTKRRQHRFSD